MENDITLQINISPGDINYASLTVPALVSNHLDIKKRLLVVDCCRPQSTKIINADIKFPIAVFNDRVKKILATSQELLKSGVITEVYHLLPEDPIIKKLSKKYLDNLYDCTHAAGATANMSYWAGIELSKSKYVLHYDGDIILYQKPGYSWVNEAVNLMKQLENTILAVPRLSPPIPNSDLPSYQEGRKIETLDNCWLNDWFSTRHFLLDKEKLNNYLPLVRGKVKFELLLRKYGRRAFPIDPEILLFKSLGRRGCSRLMLKNENAWLTHPAEKPAAFIEILKEIISEVKSGNFPANQIGYENIQLNDWIDFIKKK